MTAHRGQYYSSIDENYLINDQRIFLLIPFVAQSKIEGFKIMDTSNLSPGRMSITT
ncbi:hypothetical protein [Legionella moravica]|uniref:hypothetical protein n=1 Tax=Legionella moravica TaxID=39962 RepID=UPI000416AD59|nr:hypothetical protein [Legionella moravica]